MSYKLEKLPNEPITIYTAINFDVNELPKSDQSLLDLLAKQDELVYHIVNMRSLKLNLQEIIDAVGHVGFGENATFRHPIFKKMVRELIVVTDDPSLSMAGVALSSDIYGNLPVTVFNTLDAALVYIRAAIEELE